jgi:hypothetical protein
MAPPYKWSNVTRHLSYPLLSWYVVRKCDDHKASPAPPISEVTYVNHIDCRCGVVVDRWRGLGIFTPGPLAVPRMNALPPLLDFLFAASTREFDIDPRTLFQVS